MKHLWAFSWLSLTTVTMQSIFVYWLDWGVNLLQTGSGLEGSSWADPWGQQQMWQVWGWQQGSGDNEVREGCICTTPGLPPPLLMLPTAMSIGP